MINWGVCSLCTYVLIQLALLYRENVKEHFKRITRYTY